jgi:SAM-dependent methyltransferase
LTATAEVEAIVRRYERRRHCIDAGRYSAFDPYVMMSDQEKDRALVRMLRSSGMAERLAQRRVLEVGCGGGSNLLRFVRLGYRPQNIMGNDLLDDRLSEASTILPSSIRLISGDAADLEFTEQAFDIVCAFTVFSSILDDAFQNRLAANIWRFVKPGGGVLWYDFIYNNPSNPDVHGVPVRRVRELFPCTRPRIKRITLLPPLGRLITRLHPALYTIFNCMPLARSHVLCWLPKPM